jgi:DNA-binding transcriptional ArsR family regulator
MKSPDKNDLLHLLFPHVRAEILCFLFSDPTREIFGREAARQTTLALRTVQRELSILNAASLVTSRKEGRRCLFRANKKHRLFPALQQLVVKGKSDRAFVNKAKRPPAILAALSPSRGTAIQQRLAVAHPSRCYQSLRKLFAARI